MKRVTRREFLDVPGDFSRSKNIFSLYNTAAEIFDNLPRTKYIKYLYYCNFTVLQRKITISFL
jgi:hypothetical protein